MNYVLYEIVCAANGKLYVGYTSKTVEERFAVHVQNARRNRKTVLYSAMRKYGAEQFSVRVLLTCDSHAEACEHERRLIAETKSLLPLGYNMTHGGDGVPLTAEHYAAIGRRKRNQPPTEKQLAGYARRRGVKASDETRAKLSAARKGRKWSPERSRDKAEAILRRNARRAGMTYDNYLAARATKAQRKIA